MRLALIDLGSNSARMNLLAEEADGSFRILARRRVMTRLSEGMGDARLLRPEPMARTIAALKAFASELRAADALPLAVATAAVREAANQAVFLERVRQETGLSLFVIPGETEAWFDFQGVMCGLKQMQTCLICDTGGGSTELILAKDGAPAGRVSLPFGAMTLTDRYLRASDGLAAAKAEILCKLREVDFLPRAARLPLVGLGGSVCALAGLDRRNRGATAVNTDGGAAKADTNHGAMDTSHSAAADRVHGYRLTRQRVTELFDLLYPLTPEERIARGAEPERADTLCAGFLPTVLLMREFMLPTLTLCTYGLREGLLAELCRCGLEVSIKNPEQFLESFV